MPKKQASKPDLPPRPAPARRRLPPIVAIALAVGVAAIALFAYTQTTGRVRPPLDDARGRQPEAVDASASAQPDRPAAQTPAPTPPIVAESTVPPPNAKFGPHTQTAFPPLPFGPGPPARSPDVVRAVYRFAGEHPEVLGYVPCYCGCERSGHRGNDDCFVTARAANGDVTGWEPHGMT